MSGKSSIFSVLKKLSNGTITLGDKGKCNIIGIGKIGNNISNLIDDVYLVDGLKFNLLSIAQLCDKGNKVTFDKVKCEVREEETGEILLTAPRCNNIYELHTNQIIENSIKCLKALTNDSKLWHR